MKQQQATLTPEEALRNLVAAAGELPLSKNEHLFLDRCAQTLDNTIGQWRAMQDAPPSDPPKSDEDPEKLLTED
jgi:hypothetical protein